MADASGQPETPSTPEQPERPKADPGKPPADPRAGSVPRRGPRGEHIPFRREVKISENPKRVKGGVKLKLKEGESPGWIMQRLLRVIESGCTGDALREGLEYARLGQTKRIEIKDGWIEATVQGRRPRPYVTRVRLTPFTDEQREAVISAMARQARYAAKLLAGELPQNIEDVFAPIGVRLFPQDAIEIEVSCSCREEGPICKHAVCVAALIGERMQTEPMLLFDLRGLPGADFVEFLREHRALSGQGPGPAPVHQAHVPGVTDTTAASLEESVERFWSAGPELRELSIPVEPAQVTHPLLRRLGPSPLEGRFPLVGLLATCYDVISERVLRRELPPVSDEHADETEA